jgi:NTP pyrophosphatase (non-canonical NTP hydrolase)
MDAKTYVQNVLVLESKDFYAFGQRLANPTYVRLLHVSAGITSEVAELFELAAKSYGENLDRTNLLEECGDILWYLGVACDTLNATDRITEDPDYGVAVLKFDEDLVDSIYSTAGHLARHAGEFADLAIKKLVFYGKPFDAEPLIKHLVAIHRTVDILLQEAGFTIEDARERNIAKLKKRYGDKFSEAAALNRNLEAERKVLENK